MYLPSGVVRKFRRSSSVPGEAHEFTFCCYHKLPLLNKDLTRYWFVQALDAARRKQELDLWAYVIMPEHAHVLLLPQRVDYSTSAILQAIKQPVARRAIASLKRSAPEWLKQLEFKKSGGRVSYHFWQPGGGYDRDVVKSRVAWKSVEYLHMNPVRRGLVESPTEWRWSSARWYAGLDDVVLPMDEIPPEV